MINVVSIKFKNRGKSYFFDPGELKLRNGDKVIVETSKGLEIADCCYGNHMVPDSSVVQPLRPVIRSATQEDIRTAEFNAQREKEAFEICQAKIAEHGLDMKLVEVECSFEGNKLLFFFTSDGRVDFRELVKDLAGIFHSRIELRQIGVRDEAKMIGGIAICGRPYCCSQFLDGFHPVSTKMAKIQSLSLNPGKISGSCGRLMCCLRYEEDAYEDLVKNVPKQGAFVQTKDGYGTAMQVNLLRQTVKVKLDSDTDDVLRQYKANELTAVPGGRPKEGEEPPNVFTYVPPVEEEPEETVPSDWDSVIENELPETVEVPVSKLRDSRRGRRSGKSAQEAKSNAERRPRPEKSFENAKSAKKSEASVRPETKVEVEVKAEHPAEKTEKKEFSQRRSRNQRRGSNSDEKPVTKAEVPEEAKAEPNAEFRAKPERNSRRRPRRGGERPEKPERTDKPEKPEHSGKKPVSVPPKSEQSNGVQTGNAEQTQPRKPRNNRRRFYHGKKPHGNGSASSGAGKE